MLSSSRIEAASLEYDEVKQIVSGIGATPAQALIAWCARRGFSVIPKSVHKSMCSHSSVPLMCLVTHALQ